MRPAVQLVSATSALALERYLGREEAARFFRVVDDGFDVLNAGHPDDVKPFRRGYSGTAEQEEALTALRREVEGLRVGDARHLLPFQKGLLVDIRSVRGLLRDLQSSLGPDVFLLTRRLSQDRLESTFGLIRVGGGSNTNPAPVEAICRLTLLSLLMLTRRGVNLWAASEDGEADEQQPDPAVEADGDELDKLFAEYDELDAARLPPPARSTGQPLPGPCTGQPLPGPSTGQPLPGPSTGQPLPGPSTGQPLPGPSTGQSLPGSCTGQPPPARSTGQLLPGPCTGQPLLGPCTGQPLPGPSTGQPPPARSTGQPLPGPSTGQPLPGPSTGQSLPGPCTGQPPPARSTGQPLPGPSTGQPLPGPSTGQPLPGPSTSQPLPGPCTGQPLPGPSTDLVTGVTAEASAMAYVAGFVARQSVLGQPSARTEEGPIEGLWTKLRSMGGLTIPTTEFLNKFIEMNRQFCAYHDQHTDHLSREPGAIRELLKALIRRHPSLPTKVVRRFVRTRTFIRLRTVNHKRKEALRRREKRKRKSFANS